RLRRAIERRPVALPGGAGEIPVTISVGVAIGDGCAFVTGQVDLEAKVRELMEHADRALYGAKASGRNTVEMSRSAA
ncbi:diguanylate cyclase response regulator, partial [Rhodovulum sulfidophilum]|nr:diguanylate cyclase response regulator [Rhodovulum sulfidophilum]